MKSKWIWKTALSLVVFALGFLALKSTDATAAWFSSGKCELPEKSVYSQAVPGVYTVEGMDKKVFVLRGVVVGEFSVSIGDENFRIPQCNTSSKEKELQTVVNLRLVNETGEHVVLLIGVVGNAGGVVETETSPLP